MRKIMIFMKPFRLLICGLALMTCVACDDDDEIGSYNVGSMVIETESGDQLLVTSVGSLQYEYDDDGVLTYFYDGDAFDVTNNGTTFTYTDSYGTETCQLTLNGNGYITKCVNEGTYEGKSYSETWKETGNLSYDGSGHLTKVTGSYTSTEIWDDEKYNYSASFSWTCTWSDGLLTSAVIYEMEDDEDEGEEYEYTETFEYDYGSYDYPNAYCQFAPAIWGDPDSRFLQLSYIGMAGVGPTYLPSTVEYTETEEEGGKTYSYDGSSSYKFSFNSDGTISYQTNAKGSNKKSFTYEEYTGIMTRAYAAVTEDEEILEAGTESVSHLRFFGRRHRNRH